MANFDFGGGVGGATLGAQLGSKGGGIGIAVGAGLGFLAGGLFGGKGASKARKAEARQRAAATKAASPENVLANIQKFQQAFGAQLGLPGQALQGRVATQLGRRGLTASGLGTALTGAALSAPRIAGLQQATALGTETANRQVQAILGVPRAAGAIDPNRPFLDPNTLNLATSLFGLTNVLGTGKPKPTPLSERPLFPAPG